MTTNLSPPESKIGGRNDEDRPLRPIQALTRFAIPCARFATRDANVTPPRSNVYLEMTVEKIDLKNLFSPACARFHLATTNISGWNDINRRVQIMRRFAHWERQGKKCILLHCGDHDPGGLRISEFLRSNFEDLAKAVG